MLALSAVAPRDAARLVAERLVPRPSGLNANALDEAIAYLVRTHDVTGRQGSSKGFSLVHGWLPAYPETTGYVLERAALVRPQRRDGRGDLIQRAREMGDWEIADPGARRRDHGGHGRHRRRAARSCSTRARCCTAGWTLPKPG